MPKSNGTRQRGGISWWMALGCFLAIVVVLQWEEHKAHFLGALPYLFLAACPLMHIFMHRGHHRHEEGDRQTPNIHDSNQTPTGGAP